MTTAYTASCSNAISSAILYWVCQSLLLGTLFAGLTYVVIRLLKLRSGSVLEAGLWLIVLLKFLVPSGPSWTFSLSNVCLSLVECLAVHHTAPSHPAAHYTDNVQPVNMDPLDYDTLPTTAAAPGHAPAAKNTAPAGWHWTTFIAAGYVLCILGLLAFRVRSYHTLVARCRSLPGADLPTQNLVLDVCQRLGVRRIPSTKVSDEKPPFVMRFVRPILVIPRHLLVRPDELETVIVHEIAHLRRGDVPVRYVQWIAGVLFFFWPVVAWISRRLDAAREYACDEWALRQGKLTAPEYARCLLHVAQPVRRRFAYAPSDMAANPRIIERRIDMILQSKPYRSNRRAWRLLAFALLFCWAGATLTGVAAGPNTFRLYHSRLATEESVQNRAAAIYNLVCEHDEADFNRDGVLSYLERDTYLVALAMRNAGPFMEEFPYADRNQSGNLDILEANAVIRAITLAAYADRRACATTEHILPLEFCHDALDAQEWLLANMASEPEPVELDQIWSVLRRVKGHPASFSARMFDHGAPEQSHAPPKNRPDDRRKFQEIESGIACIKERIATAQDPVRIARLETMLTKLEAILSRLQE